jgi:hypothetical protein
MTRVAGPIVVFLSLFLPTVGSAADCGALPVITAAQAICRAREFAEKPKPPPGELEFKALETPLHWVVYYGPKSTSGARGGGADLMIEKKTGAVTTLRGRR